MASASTPSRTHAWLGVAKELMLRVGISGATIDRVGVCGATVNSAAYRIPRTDPTLSTSGTITVGVEIGGVREGHVAGGCASSHRWTTVRDRVGG